MPESTKRDPERQSEQPKSLRALMALHPGDFEPLPLKPAEPVKFIEVSQPFLEDMFAQVFRAGHQCDLGPRISDVWTGSIAFARDLAQRIVDECEANPLKRVSNGPLVDEALAALKAIRAECTDPAWEVSGAYQRVCAAIAKIEGRNDDP